MLRSSEKFLFCTNKEFNSQNNKIGETNLLNVYFLCTGNIIKFYHYLFCSLQINIRKLISIIFLNN